MILFLTAGVAGLLGGLAFLALVLRCLPNRWLRPSPRGTLEEADFLAVFALGLRREGRSEAAGESNAALAEWVLTNNPGRKPTVVQEGVYLALLRRAEADPDLNLSAWVLRLPHAPDVYVDTLGATLQCWALAWERGLCRPAVVAHDLQQQRMAWLFERIFTPERVVVPQLPTIPFDARSVQHWGTRTRAGWLMWELLLARPAMGHSLGALGVAGFVLAGASAGVVVFWVLARLVCG
jgi:hypothetical protein